MNFDEISSNGAADRALQLHAQQLWAAEAAKCAIDLSGFQADAPVHERIAWAQSNGLTIATVYARFSTKNQGSIDDQVRACVERAARMGLYCPPELISADAALSGRKKRRDGLARTTWILEQRLATVLLVLTLSRLHRQAYRAIQFIREDIVDAGLRAIIVSRNIDTDDRKAWALQVAMHGVMDEELISAIADHVREGLTGLHDKGWTTGALPVGYVPEVVPGARNTRRNLPRTKPAIDEAAAPLIRRAFEGVAAGMSLSEALRRYRADGGPTDPRSHTDTMSAYAFRRMLSRRVYIGEWHYGRKRNQYHAKSDSVRQVEQPDDEVRVVHDESLRIVSDDLFDEVQRRLDSLKSGPRGPRKDKAAHLWDLVTDVFFCPHCDRRLHTCSASGAAMHCPAPDCPAHAMVSRQEAVTAICNTLEKLLARDEQLIQQVIADSQKLDADDDQGLGAALEKVRTEIARLTRQIDALYEVAGEGSDTDRAEMKTRIRTAQTRRNSLQSEAKQLECAMTQRDNPITPDQVREALSGFVELLEQGARGDLGADAVHRAADLFRRLVGQRVDVHVETRSDRKRTVVRGVFRPSLIRPVIESCGRVWPLDTNDTPVTVWLRRPPRQDRIAALVAYLYDKRELGFRRITNVFNEAGMKIGCGNIYSSYVRYYEIIDKPLPPRLPRGRQSNQ